MKYVCLLQKYGIPVFLSYIKKLLNILEDRPWEENAGELFKTPPLRAHGVGGR